MALVETLFSEYPNGAPADWTDFWGTGDFTATIESNAAGDIDFGTKWLKYETSASDRSVLTWDDLGSMSDVCMVAKFRAGATIETNGVRFLLRVSGSAASENSYHLDIHSSVFRIAKYVAGASTVLATKAFGLLANKEYWIKFQAIGTALKAKIWEADSIEPNDWLLETTDASLASGNAGIGAYDINQDFYLDYIGVDSSEINLPDTFYDDVRFSITHIPLTLSAFVDTAAALGGLFKGADRKLTGAGVYCKATHNDQIRIAVYSGGDLVTGPQGSTLLKDFGLTAGAGVDQWVDITTADDIDIPNNTPLWIVVKGDNAAGFSFIYATGAGHCGDFQVARGRTLVEAIIGKDPDVAFAATFPAGADTFGTSLYAYRILTEDASAKNLLSSNIECLSEITPAIITKSLNASDIECLSQITAPTLTKLLAANNVECLTQVIVPSFTVKRELSIPNIECLTQVTEGLLSTRWINGEDLPCNTEVTVPSFSAKREITIPNIESSSEVTVPSFDRLRPLNASDVSSLTEITAAGIYKELFPSDIECSSEVEAADLEWIKILKLNATLPMITAEMSGGHGGFLNVELPMITAEMRGGAQLNVTLPMITAEIEGSVGIKADLNVTLPMITAEMTGTVEVLGQLNVILPMITARMTGIAGQVGQLNVTLPMITAALTGYTDIDGQLNVTLPMIEARLVGTAERESCDILRYEEPELE